MSDNTTAALSSASVERVYLTLRSGEAIRLSPEDEEWASSISWYVSITGRHDHKSISAMIRGEDGKQKHISLTREIARRAFPNLTPDLRVVHWDRDPFNLHRYNLVPLTRGEAARFLQEAYLSPEERGVTYSKATDTWKARITWKKRRVHIGIFGTKDLALAAFRKAESRIAAGKPPLERKRRARSGV